MSVGTVSLPRVTPRVQEVEGVVADQVVLVGQGDPVVRAAPVATPTRLSRPISLARRTRTKRRCLITST